MQGERIGMFGGVMGRVLGGALSPRALVSGLFLGVIVVAAHFVFAQTSTRQLSAPFMQVLIAVVLARYAVNGRWGEWAGTVFSQAGGSWAEAGVVALRYLFLTLLWIAPLVMMGLTPENTAQAIVQAMQGTGGSLVLDLLLLYTLGSILTPPLFLIVSVSAERFPDLFSGDHWRRLFAGRLRDLFSVYVIYLGAMGMVFIVLLPLVAMVFLRSLELGLFLAWAAISYLAGVSLDVLGRLCGFFAFGDDAAALPAGEAERPAVTPPVTPAGPARAVPAPQGIPPATAQGSGDPAATVAIPLSALQDAAPAAAGPGAGAPAKRPPLLDAAAPVQAAWARFAGDPDGALRDLENLRDRHAPHPQVLHALCMMRHRAGQADGTVELAGEAFPLLLERGNLTLAAEAYRTLRPPLDATRLDPSQCLALATALSSGGEPRLAATIYAEILRSRPDEVRAVKGLLQVADVRLRDDEAPADAAKIYRFLLKRCGDSPLAEFMREGLAEAERRLRPA